MRGGSVIVAGSNFRVTTDPMSGGLALSPIEGGLDDMLAHYGVTIDKTMVMDPQNEPFPIAVNRNVRGFTVQEIQSLPTIPTSWMCAPTAWRQSSPDVWRICPQ